MARSDDTERETARLAFLAESGWGKAHIQAFPGDASTRRYFRLRDGDRIALLMDAPGASETAACPPEASPDERRALGYNALARLAGNNTTAFAGLAEALTQRGFSAPEILACDLDQGLMVIEDLGDGLYARLIPDRAEESTLYLAAIDTLAALYRSSFPRAFAFRTGEHWPVLEYDLAAKQAEADLFLDWYAARRAGRNPAESARAEWRDLWAEALCVTARHEPGLVLRDFHAENLIWLPGRTGIARVGLLDFQDALFGHPAYDLVSLIEDARRDVSPALAGPLVERFVERALIADRNSFEAAYAAIAAQRNAKILGIFVRLAERDAKPRYLDLLPRVARHFVRDLSHPSMTGLKRWVEAHAPEIFQEAKR